MGERLNDGGKPVRPRAHPVETGSAVDAELAALLAEALRGPGGHGASEAGGQGELRAVAAFRAARDAGEHRVRTRRRDDWRPRTRRRTARSLRATLSVAVASLALGGVAFAAIGSATHDSGSGSADRAKQSASASGSGSVTPSLTPSPTASADRDRPASAQETEAHCRAYEQVEGRGKALDATVWQRLVRAAGGEENVDAYCAARTTSASASAGNGNGNGNGQQKTEKTPGAENPATGKGKGRNQ
ncbi:hypothetical protein ACIBVL_17620 [Streptomyces sp. NPDC049687]|uniref:hypothetical protein n=1 Tax=Streptomyces sp. NPDC049687 TaxID=3365596 RepID=UPI0037AAC574